MSQELHLDHELYYRKYPGGVQEALMKLRSEHRYPLSAADFVKRLDEVRANSEVYRTWSNLCPTLGDAIIRLPIYPFGSVRIIRGNQKLWDYIAKRSVRDGVVELNGRSYEALGGYLVPGIVMRQSSEMKENLEAEIFSYLGLDQNVAKGKRICFPKAREYPYLTLLAFNHNAEVLGSSTLDSGNCLIGVKRSEQDWV